MGNVRAKIEVRLEREAAQALGREWVTLDLPAGFSPRFSKDVNVLSDVNKLITDGLLPLSVPHSKNNDYAFSKDGSPAITDNRDTGTECRVTVDGRQYPFDRVWVKQRTAQGWELDFRRSLNHWLELASMKKVASADLGTAELSAGVLADLAEQQFEPGGPIARWIPCDYGGWVDLSEPHQFTDPPVKRVWLEDLRPWLSLPEVLRICFCEIGWELKGQVFSTAWARSIFCYLLSREYYLQSKGGDHKIIASGHLADLLPTSPVGSPIPVTQIEYDPGANAVPWAGAWFGGTTNNLPFKSRYVFCFQGMLENTAGTAKTIGFAVYEIDPVTALPTGQVLVDEPEAFTVQGGAELYANFCKEVILESGQTASMYVGFAPDFKLKKGYKVTVEPSNKSLVRGDVVELARLVHPDYLLLDLFKGFVHLVGGRIETDFENKTVEVFPYKYTDVYGEGVEGFVQEDEPPIMLEGRVVCDSEQLGRVRSNLTRYTRLSFADSSDPYISDFLKPDEPLHSRKAINGADLPDSVTEYKNPFFEPTAQWQPTVLRQGKNIAKKLHPTPYMPLITDNSEGVRSFAIGPRVLMFYGNKPQKDEATGLETRLFLESDLPTGQVGYAAHLPALPFFDGDEPLITAPLVYGSRPDDLYVKFYLGTLAMLKSGFNLNMLVMMSGADYSAWNFRRTFMHRFEGRPLTLIAQRITDFAPALDIATPMDFWLEQPSTECCDLPCSCRFTECDFYQDLGQYITQDGIDGLAVTSFSVNGIEQLDAPIPLGILRIVEFGGRQFCMNLVDALTSAGVDYFTFRPSDRLYEPKQDARFFKIKRPSCWAFEIIVSDGEEEVYKYTQSETLQKWFDSEWSPFGYGEPVGEPVGCVDTVEY